MQNTANYNLKKPEGTDIVNIQDFNDNADIIDTQLKNLNDTKVDKVAGKQLSTEDYTTAEKNKLSGIAAGANNYVHPTTDGNKHIPATGTTNNGKVLKAGATAGAISWEALTKADVGLSNVDNTSDADKPISTAVQTALNTKASNTDLTTLDNKVTGHLAEDASTIQKGHVQLSNDTNSTSETLAPTMKALNQVKQFANDGKKAVANAVTAKGVTASPSDTFPTLATKIGQIGGGIKRVQRGEVEVTTQQVFDIPISAVVYGNSIVRISSAVQYSASVHAFRAELLNDTTVRLTRNHSAASGPMRVVWEVVEFEKVKRIQRGSNVVWGETNIAINAVDLSKTMAVCSFSSRVTDVTRIDATTMEHLLTSPTNLRLFYRPVDATAHYQIVEF